MIGVPGARREAPTLAAHIGRDTVLLKLLALEGGEARAATLDRSAASRAPFDLIAIGPD